MEEQMNEQDTVLTTLAMHDCQIMLWNFWKKHEKLSCTVDELKNVIKMIGGTTDRGKFGVDSNPEAFQVDEQYCSQLCINEPVLVFSGWVIGGEYVELFFGHCNPYQDDEFTHSSLETLAEDLNAALETCWDRLKANSA